MTTYTRRDDRGTIVRQSETAESGPPYAVRAVERVCDILDILADSGRVVSLSDVAGGAGMPKSSAFRYLTVLERRHYVERDPETGSFRLGLAFRPQNTRAVETLTDLARPALEKLRDQLGETTNLGVLDGAYLVHAAVAESPHIMRLAARVGERGYMHSTALGKAICADLPKDRVRSILSLAGMPALTDRTITDVDSYLAELQRVRVNGFGEDDAENQLAGRCVAVSLPGIGLPAAISVSVPADRFPRDQIEATVRQLQKLARSLSRQLRE